MYILKKIKQFPDVHLKDRQYTTHVSCLSLSHHDNNIGCREGFVQKTLRYKHMKVFLRSFQSTSPNLSDFIELVCNLILCYLLWSNNENLV